MFRIDLCRFFYTPARGGICLHLLDQEIFFAPSQEPINLEQSTQCNSMKVVPLKLGIRESVDPTNKDVG